MLCQDCLACRGSVWLESIMAETSARLWKIAAFGEGLSLFSHLFNGQRRFIAAIREPREEWEESPRPMRFHRFLARKFFLFVGVEALPTYRPFQLGLRFSAKAFGPSTVSSLLVMATKAG